jgi:hypothetical protein
MEQRLADLPGSRFKRNRHGHDQCYATRHGAAYGQEADHLHRYQLSQGCAGRRADGYQFWLRSVAAEPKERFRNRPWTIWQYTATGRVPGIAGDVDRNAFIGSEKDWKRWLKANGVQS